MSSIDDHEGEDVASRHTGLCDSVEGRCGHGREDLRLQVISGTSWLKEAAGWLLAAACVETMAALKQVSHSRAFGGPFVAHCHKVTSVHTVPQVAAALCSQFYPVQDVADYISQNR